MSGTVNISRKIWADEAFKGEPFTEREAWVWMIMEASWKDRTKRVGDYVVKTTRGELAASVRFMSEAWKWTPSKVNRFLKRLIKLEKIVTKTETGVNVITLCKYDEYQNRPKASGTGPKQDRNRTETNENKDSISEVIPSTKKAADYQRYLEVHPKPIDSPNGEEWFSQLVADGVDPSQIIAAALAYAGEVRSWSAEAKVQQSDNFLCPERGIWKKHIPKPKPVPSTKAEQLKFWAGKLNGADFVAPSAVSPQLARALMDAGLVTPEKLKERGIAA